MTFSVGDSVEATRRMYTKAGKPCNKQGGVGRITKVNDDDTVNIKYHMGGSEKNCEVEFVTIYSTADIEKREVKQNVLMNMDSVVETRVKRNATTPLANLTSCSSISSIPTTKKPKKAPKFDPTHSKSKSKSNENTNPPNVNVITNLTEDAKTLAEAKQVHSEANTNAKLKTQSFTPAKSKPSPKQQQSLIQIPPTPKYEPNQIAFQQTLNTALTEHDNELQITELSAIVAAQGLDVDVSAFLSSLEAKNTIMVADGVVYRI